jgi:hypothetical protein
MFLAEMLAPTRAALGAEWSAIDSRGRTLTYEMALGTARAYLGQVATTQA